MLYFGTSDVSPLSVIVESHFAVARCHKLGLGYFFRGCLNMIEDLRTNDLA